MVYKRKCTEGAVTKEGEAQPSLEDEKARSAYVDALIFKMVKERKHRKAKKASQGENSSEGEPNLGDDDKVMSDDLDMLYGKGYDKEESKVDLVKEEAKP